MLIMYGVPEYTLSAEAVEVKKNARVAFTTAMVVSFFVRVPDVTERTLGIVNAYRWFSEDSNCKLEHLIEPVRKKLAEFS